MGQRCVTFTVHSIDPQLGLPQQDGQDAVTALLGGPHKAGDAVRVGKVHVGSQVETVQHAFPVIRAAGGQQPGLQVNRVPANQPNSLPVPLTSYNIYNWQLITGTFKEKQRNLLVNCGDIRLILRQRIDDFSNFWSTGTTEYRTDREKKAWLSGASKEYRYFLSTIIPSLSL